jgi:type II secretory pathway pseudopilin PulG
MTLVELCMAMAVTGILGTAIASAVAQLFTASARSTNHMVAIRQVQNAGLWVSRDAQMAQSMRTDVSGVVLRVEWTDWGNGHHVADYTIQNAADGSKYLQRNLDGALLAVSQNVDPALTSASVANRTLVFKVTSTVGKAAQRSSETRVYEVMPRPY